MTGARFLSKHNHNERQLCVRRSLWGAGRRCTRLYTCPAFDISGRPEESLRHISSSWPRGQPTFSHYCVLQVQIVRCRPLPLAGFNLISTKDGERVLAPTPETRTWRSEESTWRTRSTKTSCDEPLTRAVNKHEIQYQVESVAMRLRSSMIFLSLDELFDE
ncbi:hypothetical protein AUEXF2481DRAFT_438113 [Aureobasidium subglaciale EXF-2481]|uniref:Uncharacterized protein n=1 Tax=Aureobasidium subglaciale (strain EXF-2481) TaxID=1043005 RepID=A0A074Y352_AURSE|nr:uncharacterized protein AUEXF2481DRAFT_438113 [Aureobasidium subglaciale EXF-2481]KEQ92223.1 hypothetical protein AUEXF2481DRAFT_438113 [Aureobasidium subglaciale EXF-2481]